MRYVPKKQYQVWIDYGSEGWKPEECDTLQQAIDVDKYGMNWMVTKKVSLNIEEGK